jgi:hypothetical protein
MKKAALIGLVCLTLVGCVHPQYYKCYQHGDLVLLGPSYMAPEDALKAPDGSELGIPVYVCVNCSCPPSPEKK